MEEFLRTENPLVKDNAVMTLEYTLWKDFRWVDLNLPAPSDVPDGETATNDGEERWALVSTSWMQESAEAPGVSPAIGQVKRNGGPRGVAGEARRRHRHERVPGRLRC